MVDDDDIIGAAITDYYGSRCPDYASECPCCRAWSEYDRLSAQKCEPVVRVKELEWSLAVGRTARWEAWSIFGTQIIIFDDLADAETSYGLFHHGLWLWHRSLAEAKSAAQDDYEQRIMAAIEIIPAVAEASSDGGTEGRAGATNSDSGVPAASDSSPSHPSTIETCVRPAAGVESCPSGAIADVSVDELEAFIGSLEPDSMAVSRALLARFRIERLDRLASSGRR